jgi:AcrR family transcriptional regulator
MVDRAVKTDTETRREQIAEAAMGLIGEGGLAGLSMAAVAERVGIVPSAVYRHYPGKDAVLDQVLELLRTRMLGNVERVCGESSDALERLRLLLFLHVRMLVENRAFAHVIFAHMSSADRESRCSRLHATVCSYLSEIARLVELGQAEGRICRDASPHTVAVLFIGLVLPAAVLHRLSDGAFDPVAHAESAWPLFARALQPEAMASGPQHCARQLSPVA